MTQFTGEKRRDGDCFPYCSGFAMTRLMKVEKERLLHCVRNDAAHWREEKGWEMLSRQFGIRNDAAHEGGEGEIASLRSQ